MLMMLGLLASELGTFAADAHDAGAAGPQNRGPSQLMLVMLAGLVDKIRACATDAYDAGAIGIRTGGFCS